MFLLPQNIKFNIKGLGLGQRTRIRVTRTFGKRSDLERYFIQMIVRATIHRYRETGPWQNRQSNT